MADKDPLDLLEKQLIKSFDAAARLTVTQLNYQMAWMYNQAIWSFYNSFTPAFYRRTFSTFEGSNYTSDPSLKDIVENTSMTYLSNFIVSDEFISGNPYRADKEWVFSRTYNEGIHGSTDAEKRSWGQNAYWFKRNLFKDKDARKLMFKEYKKYYDTTKSRTFDEWMSVLTSKKRPGYRYGQQYKKYRYGYDMRQKISDSSVAYGRSTYLKSTSEPYVSFTETGLAYHNNGIGHPFNYTASIHNRYAPSNMKKAPKPPYSIIRGYYAELKKKSNLDKMLQSNLLKMIVK